MMCNGFTKLSLLTFYLQLSPQRAWKIAIWISIGIVGLASLIITTMLYIHCDPVAKAYTPALDGVCLNPATLYMATAVANIVTDVMLFVLPIPMVVQLRMSTAQKVGAMVVFGIGSVTVATSGVRLFYLMKVLNTSDLSWDAARANVWSYVPLPTLSLLTNSFVRKHQLTMSRRSLIEANLFIICGSMPTLRKFFKHFAPKLMGSSSGNATSERYGPYNGGSAGGALETIGGTGSKQQTTRKARSQYMEMHDLSPMTSNKISAEDSDKAQPDNGSEKAILQTKTVEVHYS